MPPTALESACPPAVDGALPTAWPGLQWFTVRPYGPLSPPPRFPSLRVRRVARRLLAQPTAPGSGTGGKPSKFAEGRFTSSADASQKSWAIEDRMSWEELAAAEAEITPAYTWPFQLDKFQVRLRNC